MFFTFCGLLVKLEVVKEVIVSFLPVGHTHSDIDQTFGVMSKQELAGKDILTIPDLLNAYREVLTPHCKNNNEPNVEMVEAMYDFKAWLKPHSHCTKITGIASAYQFRFFMSDDKDKSCYMQYKKWLACPDWLPPAWRSPGILTLSEPPKVSPTIIQPKLTNKVRSHADEMGTTNVKKNSNKVAIPDTTTVTTKVSKLSKKVATTPDDNKTTGTTKVPSLEDLEGVKSDITHMLNCQSLRAVLDADTKTREWWKTFRDTDLARLYGYTTPIPQLRPFYEELETIIMKKVYVVRGNSATFKKFVDEQEEKEKLDSKELIGYPAKSSEPFIKEVNDLAARLRTDPDCVGLVVAFSAHEDQCPMLIKFTGFGDEAKCCSRGTDTGVRGLQPTNKKK